MRNIFLLLVLLFSITAMAQDVIVKKDGSTILAKVTKVGENEVEYKKHNSTSDRLYTISTSYIVTINYEDGEKDVFDSQWQSNHHNVDIENSSPIIPKETEICKADNNNILISKFNKFYSLSDKFKSNSSKLCSSCFAIYGLSDSSVLSSDEIEISFRHTMTIYNYALKIKNKTSHILYIDSKATYKSKESRQLFFSTAKGANGIIAIPPHGIITLSESENLIEDITRLKTQIHKGEVKNYNYQNTPNTTTYTIVYSAYPNLKEYSVLNFSLYLKQLMGVSYKWWDIYGLAKSIPIVLLERIPDIDEYCILGLYGEPSSCIRKDE